MEETRRRALAIGVGTLLSVLSVIIVACGGSGVTPDAADAHDDGTQAAERVVHATLDEWSITGHDGEAGFAVPAGEVTFEAHNEGDTVHELVLIRTDLDAADLPVQGVVDEEAAGTVLGRTSQFGGGEMELLSYHLEPGNYALICNIPGHYQQGMYAQLVVN